MRFESVKLTTLAPVEEIVEVATLLASKIVPTESGTAAAIEEEEDDDADSGRAKQ